MKRIGICAAVVAMAPFSALAQGKAASVIPMPVIGEIKSAAAKKLKDPYSAHFEKMRRATRPNVRGEPTDVICGYVNAKNSFGGYAGARPFIYFVKDNDFNVQEPRDAIVFPAMQKTFCEGLL